MNTQRKTYIAPFCEMFRIECYPIITISNNKAWNDANETVFDDEQNNDDPDDAGNQNLFQWEWDEK